MALKLETVGVRDARQIDKEVREDKWYTVAIQLGCRTRWRQHGGGEWKPDPERDSPGLRAYKHVPAVHKVGPVDGPTLAGLISEHNRFLRANHEGDKVSGDVGRSVIVLGWEEASPPQLKHAALPFDFEQILTKLAEASATAAVTAMMKAGAK